MTGAGWGRWDAGSPRDGRHRCTARRPFSGDIWWWHDGLDLCE